MSVREMRDDLGNVYEVTDEHLNYPITGSSIRLTDVKTNEVYEVDASLFGESGYNNQPNYQTIFSPSPQYQERLIKILLEDATLDIPGAKERFGLLLGPILAIGKVTSKEDHHILLMKIENLIRSLYISNVISADDSIHLLDQIEFFADWQLRRSVTYDNTPNEREWLTVQSIHHKSQSGSQSDEKTSGLLSGLSKIFGRG